MTLKKSITALFALTLSASTIAETLNPSETPIPEKKSFFDVLSDKELTFSAGHQINQLDSSGFLNGEDLEFTGTYFSASFKPSENFRLSVNYFKTESDSFGNTSLESLYEQMSESDGEELLSNYGLDLGYNGYGYTYDTDGFIDSVFINGYFSSTSIEMNEFEIGAAYVLQINDSLNYNIYLGYISGELVINEGLSLQLADVNNNYEPIPEALENNINTNSPTDEGTNSSGEQYIYQDYKYSLGYSYVTFPTLNPNAHDASTTIDFSTLVMKIEADFSVTDNFSLIAGLSSETTSIDNADDSQDLVYNLGASYSIWNGIGIELGHKIYDGQSKTSVGVNYRF
ncbi:hypothetical protein GCM10008107_19150 [Psychrosphaera saromensis]|uniref:Autotransporter domain-containing protein n=1 Tax=Psychrosphaera saromensis TaxID=716813 RepID=A0A2S7URR9_9GAMM|nr:hypothetical protein [Psychrosphaera saromensis]PQJ52627.1 hypothetical protein BTO11_02460 [Psychrosphaera saromensis]GHB69964.1 hypothetical protein GCM10008107_19150 [Psychrosphaera saromensis]GLQ13100.1 hypothetical protein GCM10007917_05550 [Psychrosphaera saromensis]